MSYIYIIHAPNLNTHRQCREGLITGIERLRVCKLLSERQHHSPRQVLDQVLVGRGLCGK